MSDATRRRFVVHGSVQGVGSRWATKERADRLAIAGHARNLVDGTVEVEAEGDADAIAELAAWLEHGPPSAREERVDAFDRDASGQTGFRIG